uniref:Uncharacterized protein n=1 Tax=Coturnix japonica TaxID=93934 RepID=A0A8C2Y7Y5_COTJA
MGSYWVTGAYRDLRGFVGPAGLTGTYRSYRGLPVPMGAYGVYRNLSVLPRPVWAYPGLWGLTGPYGDLPCSMLLPFPFSSPFSPPGLSVPVSTPRYRSPHRLQPLGVSIPPHAHPGPGGRLHHLPAPSRPRYSRHVRGGGVTARARVFPPFTPPFPPPPLNLVMMFRDQVGIVAGWFKGWNECEQTVALLSLLKRVTRTQARFLQLCLEHSLADCADIHLLEAEANSAAAISQWPQEPAEAAVALLLAHLPLLQPGNAAAKAEYMKRLQKVLAYAIESNRCVEESRQLLSYALIHPATTLDDRSALALWLGHLEERLAGTPQPPRPPPRPDAAPPPPRRAPHDWPEHGPPEMGPPWPEAAPRENGHPPFHPPNSGNGLGGTALPCQLHPSPLKRSLSLVPGTPRGAAVNGRGGRRGTGTPRTPFGDHAPLSPQSSVASSGSEQTEEPVVAGTPSRRMEVA